MIWKQDEKQNIITHFQIAKSSNQAPNFGKTSA